MVIVKQTPVKAYPAFLGHNIKGFNVAEYLDHNHNPKPNRNVT